ncbi:MAG TPA: hypothetical protein VEQ18_02915, partial [Candidatus Nitrosocosmicus sp.]|nr:hypothetical protein [Candidatus Nitrosocosmicus sp.]
IDHINLENSEIKNIINKLTQQTVDNTTVSSTNEAAENTISLHNEDKETLENSQINEEELGNNSINDNNQELQKEEEGDEGIKKELEDSVPEISNAIENENEHNEISQIITSAN